MIPKKMWCLPLFFFSFYLIGQNTYVLSGYVSDAETNEKLIGVNVLFPELKQGTTTNEYGFYSLSVPPGIQQLVISYLGFESVTQSINFSKDTVFEVKLNPAVEILEEVILNENVERLNLKSPQMSVNSLAINTIKKIPAALGEVDIIRSITLLPGVTNGGEGS